jgi:four helix bundle protein
MAPPYNIQERTFQFALHVVQFCRDLWEAHPVTRKISWQLLDAATSIGANMEEAEGGQSKRDFVAKVAIAKKEARESVFWLRLIAASDPQQRPAVIPLLDEAKQIARVLTAIKKSAEGSGGKS